MTEELWCSYTTWSVLQITHTNVHLLSHIHKPHNMFLLLRMDYAPAPLIFLSYLYISIDKLIKCPERKRSPIYNLF